MNGTRLRMIGKLDRLLAFLFPATIIGTAIAFGGAAWWSRLVLVAMAFLLSATWFLRCGFAGRWPLMFSPLTLLGALVVGLGAAQLMPWPGPLASMASPKARTVNAFGTIPELAKSDDPSVEIPAPFTSRSPLTLDRGATLRWLVGAAACLALFCVVSHFTNRLRRLSLIWGSVAAAFIINGAFVAVQLVGGSDGLFGFIAPGAGPRWALCRQDALESPGRVELQPVALGSGASRKWIFPRRVATFELGTMPGGADAFLAFGSLGLPLTFALTMQLMAPRGSREPLWARLSQSGSGSLLILLYASCLLTAFLVGLLAGRVVALPFLAGIGLIGVPSLLGTGLRLKGFFLTALTAGMICLGIGLGENWEPLFGNAPKPTRPETVLATQAWKATLPILRDFPFVGVGLGAYSAVAPYYKPGDSFATTSESSLLQFATESGLAGLVILGLAAFWCLVRLPVAISRVGSADRALAFGFVGTLVCFAWYAACHWSIELTAVAVAASVFAGTMNRWLAGGTDLLVETADG